MFLRSRRVDYPLACVCIVVSIINELRRVEVFGYNGAGCDNFAVCEISLLNFWLKYGLGRRFG